MITHEQLLEDLVYEPETGHFLWRRNIYRVTAGSIAGSAGSGGYIYIKLRQKKYLAHRLAWFYVHKEWPDTEIDHANHSKTDNRLDNLRKASRSDNRSNSLRTKSGLKGAYFNPKKNSKSRPWHSHIHINGKSIRLGSFATEIEAHVAFCVASSKSRGEFFCSGVKTSHQAATYNDIPQVSTKSQPQSPKP